MYDLSEHIYTSFEITDNCNMRNVYHKWPIIDYFEYGISVGKK